MATAHFITAALLLATTVMAATSDTHTDARHVTRTQPITGQQYKPSRGTRRSDATNHYVKTKRLRDAMQRKEAEIRKIKKEKDPKKVQTKLSEAFKSLNKMALQLNALIMESVKTETKNIMMQQAQLFGRTPAKKPSRPRPRPRPRPPPSSLEYNTHLLATKIGDDLELKNVSTAPAQTEPGVGGVKKPPVGYETFRGIGTYKVYTTPLSWGDAYFRCADDGAHLLVVNSLTERDVVVELFAQIAPSRDRGRDLAHVGFHDNYVRREFVTVDGSFLSEAGYDLWVPDEPNNPLSENCGSITRDGYLNDIDCNALQPFICEINEKRRLLA